MKQEFNIGDKVKFANYVKGKPLDWAISSHFPGIKHGQTTPKINEGEIVNIIHNLYLVSCIDNLEQEVRIPFTYEQIILVESSIIIKDEIYDYLVPLLIKLNI